LRVEIAGDCGGDWFLMRTPAGWSFTSSPAAEPTAHVTIPQSLAWRLFTKGIARDSARAQVTIAGDRELAERVLTLTAIVG